MLEGSKRLKRVPWPQQKWWGPTVTGGTEEGVVQIDSSLGGMGIRKACRQRETDGASPMSGGIKGAVLYASAKALGAMSSPETPK
jgi:hypothetical protein